MDQGQQINPRNVNTNLKHFISRYCCPRWKQPLSYSLFCPLVTTSCRETELNGASESILIYQWGCFVGACVRRDLCRKDYSYLKIHSSCLWLLLPSVTARIHLGTSILLNNTEQSQLCSCSMAELEFTMLLPLPFQKRVTVSNCPLGIGSVMYYPLGIIWQIANFHKPNGCEKAS